MVLSALKFVTKTGTILCGTAQRNNNNHSNGGKQLDFLQPHNKTDLDLPHPSWVFNNGAPDWVRGSLRLTNQRYSYLPCRWRYKELWLTKFAVLTRGDFQSYSWHITVGAAGRPGALNVLPRVNMHLLLPSALEQDAVPLWCPCEEIKRMMRRMKRIIRLQDLCKTSP